MSTSTGPFKKLGIGIAFSPNLEANLHEAARLAIACNATLSLIHVGKKESSKNEQVATYLTEYATHLNYSLDFKTGDPAVAMLEAIKEQAIDLMILGATQQEHFIKYYVGSIARRITRQASCSVLLLIKPSRERVACKHIVVNGLKDERTENTIEKAFYMSHVLKTEQVTIVEEIAPDDVSIKVDDDETLRQANLLKESLRREEDARVREIVRHIPDEHKRGVVVDTQSIFGTRGYSIGHYALVARADLLVMNAPKKEKWYHRIIPHDLEHILTGLPTDMLVVR